MTLYLLGLIAACVADVIVTQRNIAAGGREVTLIPAALVDRFGFWTVALGTKGLFIALALFIAQPGFYAGMIVANAGAAAWSWSRRKKS